MAILISFIKGLLRLLKVLSGCFYIVAIPFLFHYGEELPLTLLANCAVVLCSLSVTAFYFAKKPYEPIRNELLVYLLALAIFSVLLTAAIDITTLGFTSVLFFDLAILLVFLALSALPVYLQMLRIKTIRSKQLVASKLDCLVLRSFALDILEIRYWTWFESFRHWFCSVVLWLPVIGEICFFYVLRDAFRFGYTFESALRTSLAVPPAISATVHNPAWGILPPVDGTLIKVAKREDWRNVVRQAMSATNRVVLVAGTSDGLVEELAMVRNGVSAEQVFIVVPASLTPLSNHRFTALLLSAGFDLAPDFLQSGALYTFWGDWSPTEIAYGIESGAEAAYEISAWCKFRAKPPEQWFDFDNCVTQPTALGRCPRCGLILDMTRQTSVWPLMGSGIGNFQSMSGQFAGRNE